MRVYRKYIRQNSQSVFKVRNYIFPPDPEHIVYPDGAECDPHRSAQSVSEIKPDLPAVFSCQRRRKSQLLLLSRQYVPDRYADICPEYRQHPSAVHGQSALHLFILAAYLRHGYLRCYAPAEHSSVYNRYERYHQSSCQQPQTAVYL